MVFKYTINSVTNGPEVIDAYSTKLTLTLVTVKVTYDPDEFASPGYIPKMDG